MVPGFKDVTITLLGGGVWTFNEIQDNLGCDVGFAVGLGELQQRLGSEDIICWQQYDHTNS